MMGIGAVAVNMWRISHLLKIMIPVRRVLAKLLFHDNQSSLQRTVPTVKLMLRLSAATAYWKSFTQNPCSDAPSGKFLRRCIQRESGFRDGTNIFIADCIRFSTVRWVHFGNGKALPAIWHRHPYHLTSFVIGNR